jgi:hypothetical protein
MFKHAGSIGGIGRKLQTIKLGNSQTFEIGDVIKTYSTGVADLGAAATPVLGVIVGFVQGSQGKIPAAPAVVAGTASGTQLRSILTDASNSTLYYAIVDISKDTLYSADVDGTIGTTNDSDLRGCWIDINSAGTEYGELLETTASRTAHSAAAGMCNCYSHGLDPNDSARLIVSIANSELDTQIDVTP